MIAKGHTRRPARSGFTLLEVLLASVIAVMLLGALYVTLDVCLTRMDASRQQTSGNDLARAVVNRMGADLTGTLGALPPKSGGGASTVDSTYSSADPTTTGGSSSSSGSSGSTSGSSGSSGSSGGSSSAGSSAPAGSSASTGSSASSSGSTGSSSSTDSSTTTSTQPAVPDVPFQAGLVGTDQQFTLFVSRVPTGLTDPQAGANPDQLMPADQRRVTYYLASDGSGLCRQERPWVTADGVRNATDPDRSNEVGDQIAEEVKGFTVEYFDGGTWVSEWDGSSVETDGTTLTGPPRAVRVTLTFESPGRGGVTVTKRVQHVFAVRAAVGAYVPPTDDSTTDTSTTTAGGM